MRIICRFFLLGDEKGMKKYITELTTEDSENDAMVANTNCNKRHREKSPVKPPSKKQCRETKKKPATKTPARKYNYKEVCIRKLSTCRKGVWHLHNVHVQI